MAHIPIDSTDFAFRFSCLGSECEDTCCKNWDMQVDDATFARYQNTDKTLEHAVTVTPGGGRIMCRDAATGCCVKYVDGLCAIHKDYGAEYLGDACHFFPRVTRRLGERVVMTAALSCPEAARLALLEEGGFSPRHSKVSRLPQTVRDYLPAGMSADAATSIHAAFLAAALDEEHSAAINMARIVSVAHSLGAFGVESWEQAVPFYLKTAVGRLPSAEMQEADPFNLLHALMGLAAATGQAEQVRLRATLTDMEAALQVVLDWPQVQISLRPQSTQAWQQVQRQWQEHYAPAMQPLLRRWVAAQMSMAIFPFAGFGVDMPARSIIMGVRFATVRLALMCACHQAGRLIDEAQQIRIVQSIARVLEHLADATLSMQVYAEPGWLREARLRALMGEE